MIAQQVLSDSRILIVDDNPSNVMILERMLDWSGYSNVCSTTSPLKALDLYASYDPDLVILDLHMPGMSGYEVLETMKATPGHGFVPVLVFTADMTSTAREKALSLGASDFLTKPGETTEISLRVRNFLNTRHLNRQMEQKNEELELKVEQRTRALWTSQIEILERLAKAAQLRQNMVTDRPEKVGELSAEIAKHLGWDNTRVELLRIAAPLHDIGKLTIPDKLLRPSAELTEVERTQLQHHTIAGADILAGGRTPLLQMAESIARYHHEVWDGSGYPEKLSRKDIPLPARIVAAADAYIVLLDGSDDRKALLQAAALAEMAEGSGKLFDPEVVNALTAACSAPRIKREEVA